VDNTYIHFAVRLVELKVAMVSMPLSQNSGLIGVHTEISVIFLPQVWVQVLLS